MLSGSRNYDPKLIPWRQLRFVIYAREFGWHPDQVEQIKLIDEPYLIKINSLFEAEIARRTEQAQLDASRKQNR